jgi:transaldolase
MRFLVDSADSAVVEEALAMGFVAGVTTNPTLMRRAGLQYADIPRFVATVGSYGAHEIHLQTKGEQCDAIVAEAEELFALDPERVFIKIPATPAGFAAAARLSQRAIPVTLTAVYTLRQVIVAQSVRAAYAAVYLGRMRDQAIDAEGLVGQMQASMRAQGSPLQLLAASIRSASEIENLALMGVASVTLPIAVLRSMLESEATAQAASTFAADAQALL